MERNLQWKSVKRLENGNDNQKFFFKIVYDCVPLLQRKLNGREFEQCYYSNGNLRE